MPRSLVDHWHEIGTEACEPVLLHTIFNSKSPMHVLSFQVETRLSKPDNSSRLMFNMIGRLANMAAICTYRQQAVAQRVLVQCRSTMALGTYLVLLQDRVRCGTFFQWPQVDLQVACESSDRAVINTTYVSTSIHQQAQRAHQRKYSQ
jgi:hypothetical protein